MNIASKRQKVKRSKVKRMKERRSNEIRPVVDPTKLFFLFAVKVGNFTTNKKFSVWNKQASLPAKNGKILR